ncbi:MAG: prepilin-type N-terminal cleavage/methylation domain-containing protein [Gammaproteobacteria bacterium]|nr:prepilin-type N-terminal cleavage/methylation domain-containing protein [Gammaproteobacteria bacterium]
MNSYLPQQTAQSGFSLLEMMIASSLGTLIIMGLLQVFASNVRTNSDAILSTKMTQELRATMDFITTEVRRAGYWSASPAPAGSVNPYGIHEINQTCLLYSYDTTAATTPVTTTNRGFRLNTTTNTIEWIQSSTPVDCASGAWTPITIPSMVTVTAVNFSLNSNSACMNATTGGDCDPCNGATAVWAVNDVLHYTRGINVIVAAQLTNAPTVSMALQETISIRNPESGAATAAGPANTSLCGFKLPLQTPAMIRI